jgi:hypothetical protein
MSYTRNYSETITVEGSKSETVSWGPSENGGSKTVTIYYTEHVPVNVNVHVDTTPFDSSVNHCSNNVNILTGAVVATEVAEIASIDKNSKKVANTIIDGFFGYIRSEISQQIAELTQNIDAQMMHLKELMHSCRSKQIQMEGDYHRISGRYVKIFEDLNNELSNRIFEMDKPAFVFKKETDKQKIRTSDNDLVNMVSIFGSDSGDLQARIGVSIAKKRALDTLNKAKIFLWQQKKLGYTIEKSMLNESITSTIFSPVCFLETHNAGNQIDKSVFVAEYLSTQNDNGQKNELIDQFSSGSMNWGLLDPDDQKKIILYLNDELNRNSLANDQHSVRVREMIQKIALIGSINAINIQKN